MDFILIWILDFKLVPMLRLHLLLLIETEETFAALIFNN
jgi:hypothetical protein